MKRKMILRYGKKSFNKTKVGILPVLINKNDIFYKNYCPATVCLFDISATQNSKQSKVKHFPKIILRFLIPGKRDHINRPLLYKIECSLAVIQYNLKQGQSFRNKVEPAMRPPR